MNYHEATLAKENIGRAAANGAGGPVSAAIVRAAELAESLTHMGDRAEGIADRAFGVNPSDTTARGPMPEPDGLMSELHSALERAESAAARLRAQLDRLTNIA